jgi:hypothetical protein
MDYKGHVVIRENGMFGADTLEVVYPDGKVSNHEWNKVNPYELEEILIELGFTVERVDWAFEHDAEGHGVDEGAQDE